MGRRALGGAAPAEQPSSARADDAGRQPSMSVAAIADATAGVELTVDELHEAVVAAAGSWAGELVMEAFQDKWPRWRQAPPLAGLRGVVCFGPNRGRKVTYTNPGVPPADVDGNALAADPQAPGVRTLSLSRA